MLDPDISTHDALRHLTVAPPTDRLSLDRRRFLQLVGMGVGAGAVAGPGTSLLDSLAGAGPAADASGPIGANDGILLIVGLYGGNDGLDTIVPIADGRYRDHRGSLALSPSSTFALDGQTGLNGHLGELKRFWDAGQLAIVEGVGHTVDEFSHFESLGKWMRGSLSGAVSTGWAGRWLDGRPGGSDDLFAMAEIGSSVPLHMVGERAVATAVPVIAPGFGVPRGHRVDADRVLFDSIRGMAADTPDGSVLDMIGQSQIDQLDVAQALSPVIPEQRPSGESEIVGKLEVAARLINANLGFRVLSAGFGSFDSHAGQPNMHSARLTELNEAIQRFFSTLDSRWAGRVTVMTFSEFGRTSHGNDGQGTDHGSAGPQLVFGAGVRGGFYGQRPTLSGLQRWDRMATHVDMRSYYASVIDGWLGGGSSDVLGGNFENLSLFATPPAEQGTIPTSPIPVPGGGGPSPAPGEASMFRGVTPERVYDTRTGLGGRQRRVGPGQTVVVEVAGVGPVPADASAVAINVTAVAPTRDTFVTVFPTGQGFPDSSTLNPRPGIVTPNSTVVGIGAGGSISVFNKHGDLDILVDVMGYFAADDSFSAAGFHPLSPSRLLDTREGNGAAKARLPQRNTMSLQVTGRGGVPASGVDAVVVNLLAVDPTGEGWVVGWPSGETMPVVSNVQYQPGRTVPTLAVVKVGAGGRIDLMASAGDLDVVVDVVGYFGGTGSAMRPVAPRRLLDTREGNGAPKARVGPGREISVQVVGRAGVPTGATAAALNVTAVAPTAHTYLTVYPGGESRETTSSLNPDPGKVSANLVISKIGADGTVAIYNNHGDVDIVADLTAFFT